MRAVSRQHLRHEVDFLHQTRGSAIDRTPYERFGICDHASPAAFANRHKEGSRIVLTEMTAVAHGFGLVSFFGLVRGRAEGRALPGHIRRRRTVQRSPAASAGLPRPSRHHWRVGQGRIVHHLRGVEIGFNDRLGVVRFQGIEQRVHLERSMNNTGQGVNSVGYFGPVEQQPSACVSEAAQQPVAPES